MNISSFTTQGERTKSPDSRPQKAVGNAWAITITSINISHNIRAEAKAGI